MRFFNSGNDGYTRGGLDVESAINLFFKGVLLFPIFLLAGYIGVAMMKHMIFHGVPVMNTVTPEQREIIREKDSEIGLPVKPKVVEEVPEVVIVPKEAEKPLIVSQVSQYDKFWNCMNSERGGRECEKFISGSKVIEVINKRN